jgi:hypothetical protein
VAFRLMAGRVQRAIRRSAGPLLLVGLLLVPLVATAHVHTAPTAARPCATCALTQHSPVVSTPVAPAAVSSTLVVGLEPAPVTAPVAPALRHTSVRGPPAFLLPQGA